jgi:GH15 family glucan-1,4-alpha-glucosidase
MRDSMADLYRHSIETMQAHQAPSGAYVASPSFPTYDYCWFRDGAFTAYAMDVAGQHLSSHRFHGWVTGILLRQTDRVERAIEKARQGEPLGDDYLHTRYTVEGEMGAEDWPNFQLDGLGTWLWALAEYVRRGANPLPAGWQTAVDLSARYLAALWSLPCYDLWEEHSHYLHPHTLAAIYAGLRAAAELAPSGRPSWLGVAGTIRRVVLRHGVHDGHIVKFMMPPSGAAVDIRRPSAVDASLLGVSTPYRLLSPEDPLMRATLARIEADLHRPGGGVYRYQADTYYGGGEWLLLAAWLGWYYAEVGNRGRATALLHWIEAQADLKGDLPEQVSGHLLAPAYRSEWEARWGSVARPLLWSHAMYVVLHHALA